LKRVEERRREDEDREEQRFLVEVIRMEEGGANLEDQEWLEEALRMEEREPNPTPASPPSLQAKMPIGEEPWWKLEEGRRKEEDDSSMTMAPQDSGIPKSIPAGARQASEAASLPPRLAEKCDDVKPGHQLNKEQEDLIIIANIATKLDTNPDHQKKLPRRPSGCKIKQTRLSLEELRKEKRWAQMSSSRNLENPCAEVPSPIPSLGATPKLTKLIQMFETSPSPIKMPRPPPASTTRCGTMPTSSIKLPSLSPSEKAPAQTDPGQCRATGDRMSADDEPKQMC
jgi:hypothetical protein